MSDTLSCPRDPEMSASPSGTLVLRISQNSETRRSKGQGLGIQLQKLRPVWWRFPARQELSLSGAAIASRSPRTSRSTSRRCGRRPGEILPVAALATGCQGLDLWSFWLRRFGPIFVKVTEGEADVSGLFGQLSVCNNHGSGCQLWRESHAVRILIGSTSKGLGHESPPK